MNARNMLKALSLALVVTASFATTGCTQRTIIEEPASESDDPSGAHLTAVANENEETAIRNQTVHVRSGNLDPGEQQATPHPQPWSQRLTPHPQPWHRDGDDADDGKSPPPPSDPSPNPDPNPKP